MLGYITQMSDTSEIKKNPNIYRLVKSWVEKMANVLTIRTTTTSWYDDWRLANAYISL